MKYLNIKHFDVANGTGVRTTLFVTGCAHACIGCFNELAQDYSVGEDFTDEAIEHLIDSMRGSEITGLTLLGGEPMDPLNQPEIYNLLKRFREEFGDTKDVWAWTGYVYPFDFDENESRARAYTEYSDYILDNIDVLVDGPFVLKLKSAKLAYRGSANQDVIDMNETRKQGKKVLLKVREDDNLVDEIYNQAQSK